MGCGIRCIISHKNLALNAMNNMAKSANINIRIDPEIKLNAEKIFSSFGITITDAINIFLHKSNPTIKSSSNTHESPLAPARPASMARITMAAPVTASPPAYTPSLLVFLLSSSATIHL